jgi:hypothetical protein
LNSLWDQYNSLLILVGLWLVARKLSGERERLEERVDTLGQHVKVAVDAAHRAVAAAKEASEAIVTAATDSRAGQMNGAQMPSPIDSSEATYSNWERVSSIWGELKERIDLRIQEIPHKRVRAKYSRMPRRTYRNIINALLKDGVLGGVFGPKLIDLDRKYLALRFKPKEVTPQHVALFEDVLRIVNGTRALPPSTNESAEENGSETSAAAAQPRDDTDRTGAVARAAS